MANHNDAGKQGEDMAAKWLLANGFSILHRNWRYGYYEIDIIAFKHPVLHIIEVKLRNHSRYSQPEDSVTKKKFRRLQKAAGQFLFLHPTYKWIQYDVVAITIFSNKEPEVYFIRDVYV